VTGPIARGVAATRYLWPLALERALPLRRSYRQAVVSRTAAGEPHPPLVILIVYRLANVASVQALLGRVGGDADVRLWALHEVAPELAAWTCGDGPGPKFALINRLLAVRPVPAEAYVAVADDDVCMARGTLVDTVTVGAACELDLFQPSHGWASIFTYPLLLSRPWLDSRRIGFVECGPLFIVGPHRRHEVLPLPEDLGMGWGIEVYWHSLQDGGCRLGVIDATPMLHLLPVGRSYDRTKTKVILDARLRVAGHRNVYALMTTHQRWQAGAATVQQATP